MTVESTNASISWDESPAAQSTYIDWGNTSSYGYHQTVGGSGSYSVFLDYLEPGTTYYYRITAHQPPPGCTGTFYITNSYQGSWSTSSEQNYYNSWGINIKGFVHDQNNNPAPSGTLVEVRCTAGDDYYYSTTTGSNGAYTISVKDTLGRAGCTADNGYYAVEAFSVPQQFGLNQVGIHWSGYWNETIVVWDPQFVNFYVDKAQPTSSSSPVVNELEFTHSSHATLTACSSQVSQVEFQSTSTASGSLFGVSYNVQSTSVTTASFGTNGCVYNQGEPGLEVWGEVETSGMMEFNAITSRSVSIPWENYYGGLQNNGNAGSGNATGAPIQDWMSEPASSSQACTMANILWYHWPIPAYSGPESYGMTVSGSVSGVSGETWGLSVPLYLDDTQIGTFGYSSGYSVTTSESSQFSVNFNIPNSSVGQYYTVACSGGNSGSGTGIVLHVWQDTS